MVKKGQRVYYDTPYGTQFGWYAGKQKIHATFKKGQTNIAPYGVKKGKTYHAISNPNIGFWEIGKSNVYLPTGKFRTTVKRKR